MQRTVLWQLQETFPHSHLLWSCSFFPPSGEETLLSSRSLSSGSAWSQLDPVLVPLTITSCWPGSLQPGWQFFLPQEEPRAAGGEEPSHSAPGTAESVPLHRTSITKPPPLGISSGLLHSPGRGSSRRARSKGRTGTPSQPGQRSQSRRKHHHPQALWDRLLLLQGKTLSNPCGFRGTA